MPASPALSWATIATLPGCPSKLVYRPLEASAAFGARAHMTG